jgi:photosystem II stability/assembly factor-like uncharacterized protein
MKGHGNLHGKKFWMRLSCPVMLIALAVGLSEPAPANSVDSLKVSTLGGHTHIHGLAVDRQDPRYLLIATHHGLFRAGPDGEAQRRSVVQDFMGFNPHPSDPDILYASGHPATGGNLGFIMSEDQGATWEQVSPGADGPVDFHQMTVSPADPQRIYGAYGELQVSDDAGKSWDIVGPLPDGVIDLAASAKDKETIYAATKVGLLRSGDGGRTWKILIDGPPVTMVETAPDGSLFALGAGLVQPSETSPDIGVVSGDWGDRYVLHLAVDPADQDRMFAATQDGSILASTDGGESWSPFGR